MMERAVIPNEDENSTKWDLRVPDGHHNPLVARDDEAEDGVGRDEDEHNHEANEGTDSNAEETPGIHFGSRRERVKAGERGGNGTIDAVKKRGILCGKAVVNSQSERGGRRRMVPLDEIKRRVGGWIERENVTRTEGTIVSQRLKLDSYYRV
ncbi:hypothetical protein FRC17_009176 [Serendipita sp. 399]|nr:hypothetical protein FRC17_009176 [Serendipita sp. 399]